MGAGALRRRRGGPFLRERVQPRRAAGAARGAQAHQEAAAPRAAAPQRVHAPLRAPRRRARVACRLSTRPHASLMSTITNCRHEPTGITY